MSTTPPRTDEQRLEALRRANVIRSYRAELKKDLKRGRRTIDLELIEDPELDTMRALELLIAVPKIGRVKATTILRRARISPSKTLGGMSERQVRELLDELRRHHAHHAARQRQYTPVHARQETHA
jgi:hypothetical protein